MIKARYESLQTRIDALSLRERAMIFIAISAVLYVLWDSLLMSPLTIEQRDLLGRNDSLRTQISALDDEISAVMARHNIDPDSEERQQLAELEQQLQRVDRQISEMVSGLIEPGQMAQILETVLQQQQGLEFVSLENLGRVALVDVGDERDGDQAQGIFRHSMRLELEGSFTQALAYLRALETLPWQFRWDEVKLTMQQYPRATIVIRVHTLSLQEGWIGV
ncbi:MAG TPA: hypothetical protein VIQ22_04345 [Gammaproteobacteria bacterium]